MKILLISNLYPPESRGGAEMIARDVAEESVRQGHELMVISTGVRELGGDETQEGVTVRRFLPKLPYHILDDTDQPLMSRLLWHGKDLIGSRHTNDLVTDAIKEFAPDLVLTFNLRGMEIGSMVRAVRKSRITWIHELHDEQLLVPSGLVWFGDLRHKGLRPMWQSGPVRAFYGFVTGYIMGSPDVVVSPSVFMINEHKKSGLFRKSQDRVLINPVEMSPYIADWDDVGETRLLYVGQLEEHKGVHDVIEALKHVGDHKVSLDILGNGSQQDELMNMALDLPGNVEVTFHGRVDHTKVFEFMGRSSALILPSVVIENCPNVILEARSCDLPVIASNVGGVHELIDPSGLFEPANPRAISEKIHSLVKGEIVSIGRKGLIEIDEYVKRLFE